MILPTVASSRARPSCSPQAARTAGVTCATTTFFGSADLLRVIPLVQRAHRAVGDALAAQRAVRFADGAVAGNVDGGTGAGALQIPDVQALDLITDLHAAHALDALGRIPDQGEILIPGLAFHRSSKGSS